MYVIYILETCIEIDLESLWNKSEMELHLSRRSQTFRMSAQWVCFLGNSHIPKESYRSSRHNYLGESQLSLNPIPLQMVYTVNKNSAEVAGHHHTDNPLRPLSLQSNTTCWAPLTPLTKLKLVHGSGINSKGHRVESDLTGDFTHLLALKHPSFYPQHSIVLCWCKTFWLLRGESVTLFQGLNPHILKGKAISRTNENVLAALAIKQPKIPPTVTGIYFLGFIGHYWNEKFLASNC